MNTQINITENGTTTLATAGKYCDRNIDVNVEVPAPAVSYTSLLDGTISGELVDDKVTSLRYHAFYYCGNLESISLPSCTKINGGSAFFYCSNLTAINLPMLTEIEGGSQMFEEARKIQEVNFPNLTTIGGSTTRMFRRCEKVTKIALPKLGGTTLQTYMFTYCYQLHTLILGGDTLNPLANTNALSTAGTESSIPLSIYVPDDLVDTYKTATNWSTYADKIKPMSELEE